MKNIIALSPILFLLLFGCKKNDGENPLPNESTFYPKILAGDSLIYSDSLNNLTKFYCPFSYKSTKEQIKNGVVEKIIYYYTGICNQEGVSCFYPTVGDSTLQFIFQQDLFKVYLKDLVSPKLHSEVILGKTYNKVFEISGKYQFGPSYSLKYDLEYTLLQFKDSDKKTWTLKEVKKP